MDQKGATDVDALNLVAKSDLFRLKAEVDKIDVDKLETVHVDLSKLSSAVKVNAIRYQVLKG